MTGVNVPVGSITGRRMAKSERDMHQRLERAIASCGWMIRNRPWRVLRNRRLLAEIKALSEVIAP